MEEPAVATAAADGRGLAAAVVSAHTQAGFDEEDSATAWAPSSARTSPTGAEHPRSHVGPGPFDFDSSAETGRSSPAIRSPADLLPFATHATVDFGNAAPGASQTDSGESAPVEATYSAKEVPQAAEVEAVEAEVASSRSIEVDLRKSQVTTSGSSSMAVVGRWRFRMHSRMPQIT